MNALLAQQLSESGLVQLHNAAGDTATISLFGAQVLSWVSASKGEQLYCSELTSIDNDQPIRGGIPVCFPQFSGFGTLPKHGVVRTVVWALEGNISSGNTVDVASATLVLTDTAQTRALWPHAFKVALTVRLGSGSLEVTLHVDNVGSTAFDFTAALHTYFAVPDVRACAVTALQQHQYVDTTQQPHALCVQENALLSIPGEVDSIYYAAPSQLTLQHHDVAHLQVGKQGFDDVVVWNPGPVKAANLSDMADADWTRMLCIEAVQLAHPVALAPGKQWQGTQRLVLV